MNPQPFILYEDAHILVCDKPSGTATQSKNISRPDMVSILKNHICARRTDSQIPGEPYLAVVHRLDQPVRGIMVFARTPYAARELSRELAGHGFEKHYRALVVGKPLKEEDVLENYLVKDAKTNYSRICEKNTPGARPAKLSYRIIADNSRFFTPLPDSSNTDFTELDIHLHTGRHHQIRVQLAGIGHPIVGDTKYNSVIQPSGSWQNLYLCSCSLDFTHPKTKKYMHFSLLQ